MKNEKSGIFVEKETAVEITRVLLNEVKRAERERILSQANEILARHGTQIKYIPSLMEVILEGKGEKRDGRI